MNCPLCGMANAACTGATYITLGVTDIPGRAVMASQGPLVRVDTGRRHFIKMTPKDAAAYASAHPVAVEVEVLSVAPEVEVPVALVVVAEETAPPDLQRMNKAALVALAEERGLDTAGTNKDLIERLGS